MNYFHDTRHPWPSVILFLPMLGSYELAARQLSSEQGGSFRNGIDAWLEAFFQLFQVNEDLVVPGVALGMLILWTVRRWKDRPKDLFGTCLGMILESILFALCLWALSRNFGPVLDQYEVELQIGELTPAQLQEIVSSIGAGIYEEVIFRLVGFAGMAMLFRYFMVHEFMAIVLAMVSSSTVFAAAHHVGPQGEQVIPFVFFFRVLAGSYFALVFQFRGFGTAVASHAGYDILVAL